jgi:hypothetical protein
MARQQEKHYLARIKLIAFIAVFLQPKNIVPKGLGKNHSKGR